MHCVQIWIVHEYDGREFHVMLCFANTADWYTDAYWVGFWCFPKVECTNTSSYLSTAYNSIPTYTVVHIKFTCQIRLYSNFNFQIDWNETGQKTLNP